MSIWRKLFGGTSGSESSAPPGPDGQGPSMQGPSSPAARKHQLRAPRVQLSALHNVSYQSLNPAISGTISLANLSSSGMGLMRAPEVQWTAPAGSEIEGQIQLMDARIPIRARVVHVTERVIGCAFQGDPSQLGSLIARYFSVELSALKMSRVKTEFLKPAPDGKPNWVYGENNCQAYFITQGDRILRFYVSYFANYIEGGENLPARYGQVVEDAPDDEGPRVKGSDTVHFEDSFPSHATGEALRFLQNVPQLTPAERDHLARLIQAR